jgi:cyanate permease
MVVIILVPVIYFLAIDRPSDRNLYPDGDVGPSMTATLQSMAPRLTSGTVFRDPNFWLIAFATGVPFAGLTGLMGSMVPLAISKGVSATSAALLLSSLAAGLFAGKILFAGVADRTNLRIALGVCLLGVSVSMLCFWYAAGYMMMVFGSFLLGAAIGVMGTLWGLLLSRGFGTENLGLVMGLVAMVKMPVQLSAPPFFGFVFDKTASYDGALLLVAALCASALVFLPYLRTRAPTVAVPAMS